MAIPLESIVLSDPTRRLFEIEFGLRTPEGGKFQLPKLKEQDEKIVRRAAEEVLVCYLSLDRAALKRLRPAFISLFTLGIYAARSNQAGTMRRKERSRRDAARNPVLRIIEDVLTNSHGKKRSQTMLRATVNKRLALAHLEPLKRTTFQRHLKTIRK